MADIFISYASVDRPRIEPLANALEDQGWSIFWDRTIPGGKTWDEVIEEELDAAKCVIVIWSEISKSSRWVRAEAEEGLKRNILVPVSIEDIKIPLLFRPIQAVPLINWQEDSDHLQFQKLISDLSAILGPSPLKIKEIEQKQALEDAKQKADAEARQREEVRRMAEEEEKLRQAEQKAKSKAAEEERHAKAERKAEETRRKKKAETEAKIEKERLLKDFREEINTVETKLTKSTPTESQAKSKPMFKVYAVVAVAIIAAGIWAYQTFVVTRRITDLPIKKPGQTAGKIEYKGSEQTTPVEPVPGSTVSASVKPESRSAALENIIPKPAWPQVPSGKKYRWKMVTAWPSSLPVIQEGCDRFAQLVEKKSNGRLKISVFAAGELVPSLEVLPAVSDGTIEMGAAASDYWTSKEPALQWFGSVPFGLNAYGMAHWIHRVGGLKLWEEVYRPHNIIPRPAGNLGMSMGGWFKKKVETINDFKGLKMKISGLGGKVLAKAGGTNVLLPGGEVNIALERGVIDAAEWLGPFHDLSMGFYEVAQYYYYPGWHEPSRMTEFIFNTRAYEELPDELQQVIDQAALDCEKWVFSEMERLNRQALGELVNKHNVKLVRFPQSVLDELNKYAKTVMENESSKSSAAKRVYQEYNRVQAMLGKNASYLAKTYYDDF